MVVEGWEEAGVVERGWRSNNYIFLGAKLREASDEVAGHVHSELFQTLEVSRLELVLLLLHLQFSLQLWRRTREKGGAQVKYSVFCGLKWWCSLDVVQHLAYNLKRTGVK